MKIVKGIYFMQFEGQDVGKKIRKICRALFRKQKLDLEEKILKSHLSSVGELVSYTL